MNRTMLATVGAVVLVLIVGAIAFLFSVRGAGGPAVATSAPADPVAVVPARAEFERVAAADGGTRVYHTLLPDAPGDEWSETKVSRTKKGDRPYLGDFRPDVPATLTVVGLPAHKMLRVTFDLFIMRSWDGSSETMGIRSGSWGWRMGER